MTLPEDKVYQLLLSKLPIRELCEDILVLKDTLEKRENIPKHMEKFFSVTDEILCQRFPVYRYHLSDTEHYIYHDDHIIYDEREQNEGHYVQAIVPKIIMYDSYAIITNREEPGSEKDYYQRCLYYFSDEADLRTIFLPVDYLLSIILP
jgi:hypothetical protein